MFVPVCLFLCVCAKYVKYREQHDTLSLCILVSSVCLVVNPTKLGWDGKNKYFHKNRCRLRVCVCVCVRVIGRVSPCVSIAT